MRPRPESAEVCAGTISLDGPGPRSRRLSRKAETRIPKLGGRVNGRVRSSTPSGGHQDRRGRGPGGRGGGLRPALPAVSQANQPPPSLFGGSRNSYK